jgi:hypothetical protein
VFYFYGHGFTTNAIFQMDRKSYGTSFCVVMWFDWLQSVAILYPTILYSVCFVFFWVCSAIYLYQLLESGIAESARYNTREAY